MPKYSEAVILEMFKFMNNVLGDDSSGMDMGDDSDIPPVPDDGGDMFDDEAFGVDEGEPMADEPSMDGGDEPPMMAHPEPDGDEMEEPARYASDCEDGDMARYDASFAAPSATNVSVPSTVKKEKARMGRSTTETEATAAGSQELLDRIAKLEAENAKLARYNRQKTLESKFSALKSAGGFQFDVADEISDLIDADDSAVERREAKIKAHYTRSPESVGSIASDAVDAGTAEAKPEWHDTTDEINAATAYSLKHRPAEGEDFVSHYRRAVAKGDAEAPNPRAPQNGRRSAYR